MNSIKNAYFPGTVKEAMSLLKKKNSFFMASSTFSFKSLPEKTENIVLGKKLPLRYIKRDSKKLLIGALTSFDDIENDKNCKNLFGGVLSLSASKCSSQLIRNMATAGGNIARPNAFNLLPVVFTALGAFVRIVSPKGAKTILIEELYRQKLKYGIDSLITEIQIPLANARDFFYFEKVSKIKSSWDSYITAAFRVRLSKGKISAIKLAFGAVSAFPYVNEALEKEAGGKVLTPEFIAGFSEAYGRAVGYFHPGSKLSVYRSELAKNLVAHYLRSLSEK